jgi:hypothetical protein
MKKYLTSRLRCDPNNANQRLFSTMQLAADLGGRSSSLGNRNAGVLQLTLALELGHV